MNKGQFLILEIRRGLKEKNYNEISKNITEMCDFLKEIHADEIILESFTVALKRFYAMRHDVAEAFVAYFLAYAHALTGDNRKPDGIKNSQTERSQADGGRKTILAVDDVTFFLSTLKQFLQDHYDIICVNSGEAALRYLQHNSPDIFIFDIEMPGMNGYELAQAVRAAGHTVPIIFVTGTSTPESVSKALKVGASDFIAKPIQKENVLEKIRKFI